MKRLLLLGPFVLVAILAAGFLAARQVAQSSNTVGLSRASPAVQTLETDLRDQDPGYSIAFGGPSEVTTGGAFHSADLLRGLLNQVPPGPRVSVACPALGLTPAGCAAAPPHDEVDALSYGRDFTQPMKPYWKWLFFSVAQGSSGFPWTGVNVEATCAGGAEPEADEFWTSAVAQLSTNGQYYDGDGNPCNVNQSNPGIGLVETPNSDDLDALDEFPAPVVNNRAYFSLGPGSPSLGPLGFVAGDVLAKTVGAPGAPGIYASRVALGLAVGDDVDAICVNDVAGDDYYNPGQGDRIWFSLTNASPSVAGGIVSGADVLAPGLAVMVPAGQMGLRAEDDLDALKCMQDPLQADKAVSDIVFDDATGYPYDGPQLPTHPIKELPYVEVSSDQQVVISVTSVEENLGPQQPADALVAFYADIPPDCKGKWWDSDMPPQAFPNDIYTLGGDPYAPPFSAEQLGQELLDPPANKILGDTDPPYPYNTYEVDLHFQTAQYGIAEPVGDPPVQVPITRFFDLGCPTPGQYHFWFCNKVEPKDAIDPNLDNNVRCEEMVVESLEPNTPTPTATNTPTPTPTATSTPTSTSTAGPQPALQDPTFSLARNGAQVPAPIDPSALVVRSPGGAPPPAVVYPCPAFGFMFCGGQDELDALSLGRDFTLPPPDTANPNAYLYFSVAPGSVGVGGSGVKRETLGCQPEPQADEFGTGVSTTNYQYMDGDGVARCANPPAPGLGLVEQPMPPGVSDDLDALDPLNLATTGPPIFFSLDKGSPDLGGLPAPSAASIYVNMGLPGNFLYAPAAALGLDTHGPNTDDIDALCINDADGNREYSPGDTVWLSLRAGSASLGANSPADIFAAPYTGTPLISATQLGLMASDELDALKCYQPPSCVPPLTPLRPDDSDCDGAPDNDERGPNPAKCGNRDPSNPWDFYNVPVPTLGRGGTMNNRDWAVSLLNDVLAVLEYSGTQLNGPPNSVPRDYDDDKDADTVPDGVAYDRRVAPKWTGAPDGNVTILSDVLLVLAQSGTTCSPPPP